MSDTYETLCRFSNDPAAPTVVLVWEWTDQNFLPGEQVINSKHWASEGERETVVGEQWDFPPRTNARDIPIGLLGGHQCGTASDFANGEEWPYTGDPVEYDEDWVPLCCPRYYGLTVGAHPESDVTSGPLVPYGPNCCAAPVAVVGNVYHDGFPPLTGTITRWYHYELAAGSYVVTWSDDAAGTAFGAVIQTGPSCGVMTSIIGTVTDTHPTQAFVLLAPATVCIAVSGSFVFLTVHYSLDLS